MDFFLSNISYELGMEFAVVVEGDGDTNDKSIWEGQISSRVADAK